MDGYMPNLSKELQHLQTNLVTQYRGRQWRELTGTLESLVKVGEIEGQRELCLRAQGIRELMGARTGGGRETPGTRLNELFTDLMFHLSHFQWSTQAHSEAPRA